MAILAVPGSVFLLVSLGLAWLATLVRLVGVKGLQARFPGSMLLVKAHIDYLLMGLLCFAFSLLLDEIPVVIAVLMIVGATINPALFVVLAMDEPPGKKPGALFTGITVFSFVSATVGFGGAAVLVILSHI